LKATIPTPALRHEAAALQAFDGQGAVRLIDSQVEQGVLLLERAEPGTALTAFHDDRRATSVAAHLMQQIWRRVPIATSLPTISDWASDLRRLRDRFAGKTGPFTKPLVEAAESLFTELLPSQSEPVLLHGDLHHDNILASTRAPWLAIDPKGVVGEPAYEAGAFLRNPMPGLLRVPDAGRVLSRRLDQLSEELGLDRSRLLGWGLAQSVLAAWWCFDDSGADWKQWLDCAALLLELGAA
jgi:streptomycin 6-kinase